MLVHRLATTSASVRGENARNAKISLLADAIAELGPDEIEPAIAWLSGGIRQGRIGIGWAAVAKLDLDPTTVTAPSLSVAELDAAFEQLARTTGTGSVAARRELLGSVLGRATATEVEFVRRLIVGDMRQGALAGIVTAAIVRASQRIARPVTLDSLRRATMLLGDLGAAAALALGPDPVTDLDAVGLVVLRAVEPMLAATSDGVDEAIAEVGPASVEWKLDGARVQVHRQDDRIRVFTRNLNDVTDRLPEVVEAVRSLPVDAVILDGEVLGLDADAAPRPFQQTMARFGTEAPDIGSARLHPYFFDVLHLDGVDLIDQPLSERRAVLDRIAPELRVPAVFTDDAAVAAGALSAALAAGHEGVMVKSLDGRYEAGRRGRSWRKVKPVYTYDLVVIGVERGNGRRRGTLSNLHLGARNPETGEFVMVGKTFKGLTDDLLDWQTRELGERVVRDDGYTLEVRPELVVEIAIDGVQRSTRYPGGVALRFARVKGYRPDRSPDSADTIGSLRDRLV
jgi:DNA ligase-1